MAPCKGTKRGAASSLDDETAAKKSMVEPVIDGILSAKHLPEPCRDMLIAAFPASVSTPSEARSGIQTMVVTMVDEVLQTVEKDMQDALVAEKASVITAEEVKGKITAKLAEAGVRQTEATEAVKSKTAAVVDFKKAVSAAETDLTGKKEVLIASTLEQTRQAKERVEKTMQVDVKAIVEGQPGAHYKNCLPIVESLDLDESLRTALPSACTKIPSDRGPFDTMVVDQLEKSFQSKLASLVAALAEEEAVHRARTAAVEAAEKQLVESKDVLRRAQDVLSAAQEKERESIDSVKAAQAAMEHYEPEYQQLTASRNARAEALELFQQHNLSTFQRLRDAVGETSALEVDTQAKKSPAEKTPPEAVSVIQTEAAVVVGGA